MTPTASVDYCGTRSSKGQMGRWGLGETMTSVSRCTSCPATPLLLLGTPAPCSPLHTFGADNYFTRKESRPHHGVNVELRREIRASHTHVLGEKASKGKLREHSSRELSQVLSRRNPYSEEHSLAGIPSTASRRRVHEQGKHVDWLHGLPEKVILRSRGWVHPVGP